MIPFWQVHSPLEIALEAILDTVWCIGLVIGWCIALWRHFTAPTVPTIDPHDIALPYSEMPVEAIEPTAKPKRTRRKTKAVKTSTGHQTGHQTGHVTTL